MIKLFLFGISVLFLIGCASGHCRGRKVEAQENKTVVVFKYDDSKQCDKKSGIKLEVMQKNLVDIQVHAAAKKNDGKMRMTVCGGATGMMNTYVISLADLDKAKKLGFEVLEEP